MEERHVFIVVIVALITAGVTLSTIVQAWATSRGKADSKTPPQRLDSIDGRLSRLEEMVETVAIEMERVAEGQRFTAKLLAERGTPAAQPLPSRQAAQGEGRITTPH